MADEEVTAYTTDEAFGQAVVVVLNVLGEWTNTGIRDKAIRLYLKYKEGELESFLIRSSTIDYTDYINNQDDDWSHLEDDLTYTPMDDSDAIVGVWRSTDGKQTWSAQDYSWRDANPLSGYDNALTVTAGNAWFKVKYWYDDTLNYEDLTESLDYYARVFLNAYTDGNFELYKSDKVSDTPYNNSTKMNYTTDISSLDIDAEYGSAGNIFANTLHAYYLSYTGVSIDIGIGSDEYSSPTNEDPDNWS